MLSLKKWGSQGIHNSQGFSSFYLGFQHFSYSYFWANNTDDLLLFLLLYYQLLGFGFQRWQFLHRLFLLRKFLRFIGSSLSLFELALSGLIATLGAERRCVQIVEIVQIAYIVAIETITIIVHCLKFDSLPSKIVLLNSPLLAVA